MAHTETINHYNCLNPDCELYWTQPGMSYGCPDCGHLYQKWMNYDGEVPPICDTLDE